MAGDAALVGERGDRYVNEMLTAASTTKSEKQQLQYLEKLARARNKVCMSENAHSSN